MTIIGKSALKAGKGILKKIIEPTVKPKKYAKSEGEIEKGIKEQLATYKVADQGIDSIKLSPQVKEYYETHKANIPPYLESELKKAETEEEVVAIVQEALKRKHTPKTPPSGKGTKDYLRGDPDHKDFTMSDTYDKTKVPAIRQSLARDKTKVDPSLKTTGERKQSFTMSEPYDPKKTPALISKVPATTEERYFDKNYRNLKKPEDDIIDAEFEPRGIEAKSSLKSKNAEPKVEPEVDTKVKKKDLKKKLAAGGAFTAGMLGLKASDFADDATKTTQESDVQVVSEDKKPESKKIKKTKPKPKPEKPTYKPKDELSDEEKSIQNRMKGALNRLDQLENPPMTSADLRKQMADDLKKARGDKEKAYQISRLAQQFVSAITKYSAAKEGLARGLDMSSVEVRETDWDKMIDRAQDSYKSDLSELITKFDKEDKAKKAVDTSKEKMHETLLDMKQNMAKLKDMRKREAARAALRRAELAQRSKESQLDRDSRERIARGREEGKRKRAGQFNQLMLKYTKDPKVARALVNAALRDQKTFDNVLKQTGILGKLDPEALQEFRENVAYFWQDEDKSGELDTEKFKDALMKEDVTAQRPSQSFPIKVAKGNQRTKVKNQEELNEALSEGWEIQ